VDQRVDLGQRGVGFHVAGVELLERIHGLGSRSLRHPDALDQQQRLLVGEADQRIDEDLDDLLGRVVSDFLDVHAAFGRGHDGDLLRGTVSQGSDVVFVLDVGAFLDQEVAHLLAFGAGLVGDQLHAEDLGRVLAHFVQRLGDLDTTALAATASVDLGLDHPDLAAELLCCLDRVIDAGAMDASRRDDTVLSQYFFCLILMNLHGCPSF